MKSEHSIGDYKKRESHVRVNTKTETEEGKG